MSILAAIPDIVIYYLPWFVSGLIVILGLFVYGLRDVLRSNVVRIWAIGGVCFRDAIRRRVLWITPLAMLGIVIAAGLQRPVDEQDAIRLTIKYCFLTSGLVVTIIAIITACTNLPREVESRVIYTIVTKPVTRLEIVIGKIVGFARVSAAILLIMGLFSLIYLHAQAFYLEKGISRTLQSESLDPAKRDWLTHYQAKGLLSARSVTPALAVEQFARLPSGNDQWGAGGMQEAVVPFDIVPEDLADPKIPGSPPGVGGAALVLYIPFEAIPTAVKTEVVPPVLAVQILDRSGQGTIYSQNQVSSKNAVELVDPTGYKGLVVPLTPEQAMHLADLQHFCVQLIGMSGNYLYNYRVGSVALFARNGPKPVDASGAPVLRGSKGRYGQQLRGPEHGVQSTGVFVFRTAETKDLAKTNVSFEIKMPIERSGGDDAGVATTLEIRARHGDKISGPILVYPESRRTAFFQLPGEFLGDGNYELLVQNKTAGHVLGISAPAVAQVSDQEYFGFNLFKGLFILWLFTILVSTAAFCCSTFLSWPIAVVLTVLLILGRWGVSNLDMSSGLGPQIANELFPNSSTPATVVSQSVEALNRTLRMIASVLPDIGPFGVGDQIERGVTITLGQLAGPFEMLAVFGLPLLTGAYVFLRNREVAP